MVNTMKKLGIIGSTGSIGLQTLDIVRRHRDRYEVSTLSAKSSVDALIAQSKEFEPKVVGIFDQIHYKTVRSALGSNIDVVAGVEALKATVEDVDTVVAAVVGMQGLTSVMAAIEAGADIALANKESLVVGGNLVMDAAKQKGIAITPVDSEHSAVWQCLNSGRRQDVRRIILTASGGPFRGYTKEQLLSVTLKDALKHPTWAMGQKITIDSATMANKALEIIEARWLFETTDIEYVVHPESIIHSMVEFCDGSTIAQMSYPTMEIPIQLAISSPDRLDTSVKPLDLGALSRLTFFKPDEEVFSMPAIARRCIALGGTACAVFNAANEAANLLFRQGKIGFVDIMRIVERAIEYFRIVPLSTIDEVVALSNDVFERTPSLI